MFYNLSLLLRLNTLDLENYRLRFVRDCILIFLFDFSAINIIRFVSAIITREVLSVKLWKSDILINFYAIKLWVI